MKKKVLLVGLLVVLVAAVSVGLTVAFLTSQAQAVNTFTVGDVDITLDEAKVDENGVAVTPAQRVKENSYKLIPGHTYVKDPIVTVSEGSEDCYVRVFVTLTNGQAIYNLPSDIKIKDCFVYGRTGSYNNTDWTFVSETRSEDGERYIYEFRHNGIVTDAGALPAIFDKFICPNLTNAQLKTLEGLKIYVAAQAVQADGFATAEDAFAAAGLPAISISE